jgi:serine/threonine protein kinase
MKLCLRCNQHFDDGQDNCPTDEAELISVGNDPLIGTVVGDRYRILCAIGRGAMGIVYEAIQISTGREMAIKVLQNFHETSQESVKRFRREAQTVSTLKHPNIVTLFDYGMMEDGQPYIVTEFLQGLNLAQVLKETGGLPPEACAPIIKQVCYAVGEAHRLRIIHRDLKPDNIILQGKEAATVMVKVVDFGVAKLVGDGVSTGSLTVEGKVCGSPAYMSPEQCRGAEFDYRADIYSLGIVIFEMLSGKRPFVADDMMALMFMHVNETPPRMSDVEMELIFPEPLEKVVAKALSKNPDKRQQSAEELWEEFNMACSAQNRKLIVSGGATWIPFGGSRAPVLSSTTGPLETTTESVNRFARMLESESLVEVHEEPPEEHSHSGWGKNIFLHMVLMFIVAIFAICFIRLNDYHAAINSAEILNNEGRPEDAIKILEKLQKQYRLTDSDSEVLHSSYLQAGLKLMKKKKFKEASIILQRIPDSSSNYDQAQEMLRRNNKRKVSSSS